MVGSKRVYPLPQVSPIFHCCESYIFVNEGCTEKFQQFQLGNTQQMMQSTKLQPKMKSPRVTKRHPELPVMENNCYMDEIGEEEKDYDEYYEEEISYTTTLPSRFSRGVSTKELEKPQLQQKCGENLKSPVSELTLDGSSPPSTTSSNLPDKANESSNTSKRYEDSDPIGTEPLLSRNSMLFQLIACCGSSLPFKAKNIPIVKQQQPATSAVARKSNCSDLHRGVLCKNAAVKTMVVEEVEDEIKCMRIQDLGICRPRRKNTSVEVLLRPYPLRKELRLNPA